jgi:hypothetical protein
MYRRKNAFEIGANAVRSILEYNELADAGINVIGG